MAPNVRPPIERFKEKVRVLENGCHEWTAYRGENGYARFYVDGRGVLAHRWVHEQFTGPIPEGMQIDHVCRNRACVNPDHLEAVEPAENIRRSTAPDAARKRGERITHCPRGHEYTPENTYLGGRGRTCRACKRLLARRHYEMHRDEYIQRSAKRRSAKGKAE